MAFVDENGKITIDEEAAIKDINNMKKSIENLNSVSSRLDEMLAYCTEMKGSTATALYDVIMGYRKEIQLMVEHTNETISFINRIISVYKEKDEAIKNMIENNS